MRTGHTRAFELIWPNALPAFVGCGTGPEPWLPRWQLRAIDGSRLGAYLRGLDAPLVSTRWLPDWPMHHDDARRLAHWRLRQIAAWAGEGQVAWLLNEGWPHPPRSEGCPVSRLRPDGGLEHFKTIFAASQARGVDPKAIWWRLRDGGRDRDGGRWVERR
jgi:hypothetical protein